MGWYSIHRLSRAAPNRRSSKSCIGFPWAWTDESATSIYEGPDGLFQAEGIFRTYWSERAPGTYCRNRRGPRWTRSLPWTGGPESPRGREPGFEAAREPDDPTWRRATRSGPRASVRGRAARLRRPGRGGLGRPYPDNERRHSPPSH